MNKPKIVAGIELGSAKVSALIGQASVEPNLGEAEINILGAAASPSTGMRKGQIVDIEEAVGAIVAAVEAAERMAGYNLESAFVAVGGAHVHSQNSHGVVAVSNPEGEISSDDAERAIEAASAISLPASREVIHILPREFIVDGEAGVRDPVGMTGVRLEVETHIVTVSAAAIKNIRKAINEVGVELDGLVFSGLAASEATLSRTEKELGSILVDIGGGTTSMAVFIDGALAYSGVLPIGAKNVTNDLAIGLRVSLESAEKIKLALSEKRTKKEETVSDEIDLEGLGVGEIKKVSKKTLTEGIIRPRLNEIFSMVRLTIEKEGLLGKVPSGAVLTGGGAETVGAAESAKRMLSLPVRIGVPKGIGGLVDDIINPSFATPIGLVLYGAGLPKEESLTSFAKKIRLPGRGTLDKITEIIKDLLP